MYISAISNPAGLTKIDFSDVEITSESLKYSEKCDYATTERILNESLGNKWKDWFSVSEIVLKNLFERIKNENEAECSTCYQAGVLISCNGCPRYFHASCRGLTMPVPLPWFCGYCHTATPLDMFESCSYPSSRNRKFRDF